MDPINLNGIGFVIWTTRNHNRIWMRPVQEYFKYFYVVILARQLDRNKQHVKTSWTKKWNYFRFAYQLTVNPFVFLSAHNNNRWWCSPIINATHILKCHAQPVSFITDGPFELRKFYVYLFYFCVITILKTPSV